MKNLIFMSLLVGANLCTLPALAQFNQNTTQFAPMATPFGVSSGTNNVIQPAGATNRPFANNINFNNQSQYNGFNYINGNPAYLNGSFNFTTPTYNTVYPFGPQNQNEPNDTEISDELRRGFIAPGLSASARASSISTSGGTVTLSGTVSSLQERNRLEQIARGTNGVKTVINQLQIKPQQ